MEVSTSSKRRPRRTYPKEFKAELVARCDLGEQSLAQIAMDHQINANLLRRWQRELHEAVAGETRMVPVSVQAAPAVVSSTNDNYIELLIGTVQVRFHGRVDPSSVAAVLNALR